MKNPIPAHGFIQIAIVVEDIEAAIDALRELVARHAGAVSWSGRAISICSCQ